MLQSSRGISNNSVIYSQVLKYRLVSRSKNSSTQTLNFCGNFDGDDFMKHVNDVTLHKIPIVPQRYSNSCSGTLSESAEKARIGRLSGIAASRRPIEIR